MDRLERIAAMEEKLNSSLEAVRALDRALEDYRAARADIRALADYLDGDTYYKIDRPAHNLDRARCQCRLLADMEAKQDEMYGITAKLLHQYSR